MKTGLCLLLLGLFPCCFTPARALDCIPADITLSSQESVNGFQSNHGPCDRVAGQLKINGADISSLAGLSGLSHVGRLDILGNQNLVNLTGLEALEQVGDLTIRSNPSLRNLEGLSGLTRVAANLFEIDGNDSLLNLDGLSSLETVVGSLLINGNGSLQNIDGLSSLSLVTIENNYNLEITRNPSLTNLDGLASLTELAGALPIYLNDSLADLGGLSSLTRVGAVLLIAANGSLRDLDGLSALQTAGALGITNNAILDDISGLSGLRSVDSWLEINWNPALTRVDGLSSLTQVGIAIPSMGVLRIDHNLTLGSMDGFSALQEVQALVVENNPALSDCRGLTAVVDPLDDFEPGPGPGASGIPDIADQARFGNNASGCNSGLEILGSMPLAGMNAGLNDAWFDTRTDGQGFLIVTFPDIRQMFLAWFTYDTERPGEDVEAMLGEPGHRWLTAQGGYDGNVALLDIYVTSGGIFDAAEPVPFTGPDGEMTIEFDNCNSGRVSYDIYSVGHQGVIPIQRIALDNISLCYLLARQQPRD